MSQNYLKKTKGTNATKARRRLQLHLSVYLYLFINQSVCLYVCMCVCMYVCMPVCLPACLPTYLYCIVLYLSICIKPLNSHGQSEALLVRLAPRKETSFKK